MRFSAVIVAAIAVTILTLPASSLFTVHGNTTGQQVNPLPSATSGVFAQGAHTNRINGTTLMDTMFTLHYRNQGALDTFLQELQNPGSPYYHRYMTSSQFTQAFSPASGEYYGYVHFFRSRGFVVHTFTDRTSMALRGTASRFEAVFHTTIADIHYNGRYFHAPTSRPYLTYGTPGQIAGITGLSDQFKPVLGPLFTGSGSSQALYGADMQAAYQLKSIYQSSGYPTNETIATILWSGTNSSGTDVGPYVPSDITHYFNNNIPKGEPVPTVYGYPIGGAPLPGPSASYDTTQANYESTLDLEMAGSTAPGANVVEVYGPQPSLSYLDQALGSILNPSYNATVDSALSHVVAVSNSWGSSDGTDSTWSTYEQEAAARGITVLASSGDNGNTNSASPSFPATVGYNSYGTLSVGGSAMTLTGTTSTNGSGTTGIATQSVWYNTPSSGDGSQGGVSSYYAEPKWQANSADANSVITGSSGTTGVSSGRGTPDLSGDGANMMIYITLNGSPGPLELWGTSVASPLVAGEIAAMDHSLGPPEGFMNPALYRLAQAEYNGTLQTHKPMYFITNGSNGMFPATSGYSLAVGWGTINAYNFVLDQTTPLSYTVKFNETGLPPGTLWYINITGQKSYNSTSSSISTNLTDGTYSYTAAFQNTSYSSPGGSFSVSGSPVTVNVPFSMGYGITFNETGLPASTLWYINITGGKGSGPLSGNQYAVLLPNGTYTYRAGSGNNSYSAPSGSFTVSGSALTVDVNFTLNRYSVTFQASYAASSTVEWYINLSNGQNFSTSNRSLTFSEPNGTLSYTLGSGNTTFIPSPASGTLTVRGSAVTVAFSMVAVTYTVRFNETGMPEGLPAQNHEWYINITGIGTYNSTGKTLELNLTNGTYGYRISSGNTSYRPVNNTGTLGINGAPVSANATFRPVTFSVAFTESGLPYGSRWYANVSGDTALSSTGTSTAALQLMNGTYSYTATSVNSSWNPAERTGFITVSGSGVTGHVAFSEVTYTLTVVENGLVPGTVWSVSIEGTLHTGSGRNMTVQLPNGTHSYSVTPVTGYTIEHGSGNITLSGSNTTLTVSFTKKVPAAGKDPVTFYALAGILAALVIIAASYRIISRRK